ncbi:MAG: metallophosphoesterase [Balneolaceae bacterium]|nr:metallophosphoesterase [Balneolaceae bacterium]
MLIGLISDTHDHVPHIREAVSIFKEREVELVLHAGDYCSPFTIPHFEGVPLQGIFGNNDGDKYLLMEKFRSISADLQGDFMEVQAGGRELAVYHGTDQPITDALIHCGNYDAVISGHTHESSLEQVNGTLAVNPGTAHGFEEEATIAVLETDSLNVEYIHLS